MKTERKTRAAGGFHPAATQSAPRLDNISNEALLEKANAGLLGDDGQGGGHATS